MEVTQLGGEVYGGGCEKDAEVKVCVRVCRHEDVGVEEWVWRGECGGVGVHVGGE